MVVRNGWVRDGLLRIAGLILLASCWLLARWLFHSSNLREHHDPTIFEWGAAAASFLSFSTGAAFTILGEHIFDEIEISARWARHSMHPGENSNPPPPMYLLGRDDDVLAAFQKRDSGKTGTWGASAWRKPDGRDGDK